MSMRRLVTLGLLALGWACNNGNHHSSPTTPAPPPPPPPSIAGNWAGTSTITSVQPDGLCVSDAYVASRLNVAEAVSATFTVNGTALTVQYTTLTGVCTATGTLNGQAFQLTVSACTPTERQIHCRGNQTRVVYFKSQTISGTADAAFTAITGTSSMEEGTRTVSGTNTDPVETEATLALHR
jgi:hypothetical protein